MAHHQHHEPHEPQQQQLQPPPQQQPLLLQRPQPQLPPPPLHELQLHAKTDVSKNNKHTKMANKPELLSALHQVHLCQLLLRNSMKLLKSMVSSNDLLHGVLLLTTTSYQLVAAL